MKKITFKTLCISFTVLCLGVSTSRAQVIFSEGFDAFATTNWVSQNLSNPLGTVSWQQGVGVGVPPPSGAADSYAESNYQATDAAGSGTISDWLFSPTMMLKNFDTVSFYTLSFNSAAYPDRVQCLLSSMGTSTNAGTTETSVGDFTTTIFEINPLLDMTSYPSFTGAGDTWTKFSGIVTGLTGTVNCRVAIRYFVTDGGGTGANSSTVGIDDFSVNRNPSIGVEDHSLTVGINMFPNPTEKDLTISFSNQGDYLVNIFNSTGQIVKSFTANNTTTVDVSDLASSLYGVQIIDTVTGNNKTINFIKK